MKIITGSGRCGTSVLVKILRECGCDFRGAGRWIAKYNAGMENARTIEINERICGKAVEKWLKEKDAERIAEKMGEEMRKASCNFNFVKDPRFSKTLETWIKAKSKIDLVVICVRDFWAAAESAKKSGAHKNPRASLDDIRMEFMARFASLVYLVRKYEVPYAIARYPEDYTGDEPLREVADTLGIDKRKMSKACRLIFKVCKLNDFNNNCGDKREFDG